MRITGKGIWGPPEDRPETLRILKRVPELGIVHRHRRLYGPDVSKELIRDALYNYDGILIATKAGFMLSTVRAAQNTPRLYAPHCLTGGGALPVSCP